LRERQCLIVLDSCEHVIEAAAALAEEIFTDARSAHILATSREPLSAEGERVHRLAPLSIPPATAELTAAEAMAYPAVQLFVERAAASLDAFELSDADAPVVADLCRRLDGIALAIEIAAGRVDAFGVAGLAARLDDRFRLLMRGRRTALPRHQTLNTTLGWSYALLPESERVVLRRLAVFAGVFTMESASTVLAGQDATASDIVEHIANLVAKSLVAAGVDGDFARYRLLDTTRAYAFARLEESGERQLFARRHAQHYHNLSVIAEGEWHSRRANEWLEDHRHLIDNVRAALEWAFAPSGDAGLGVALTVAALPLWFQLSLMNECCERVQRALASPSTSRDAASEMRLNAALASSLMQTRGSVAETREAWLRTLELSEALDDADYQLRALWGLWAGRLNNSEFRAALALAERFADLAASRGDEADQLVGDRMIGYILHLLGDQARARRHIERMLSRYMVPVIGAQVIRYVFDQQATARCFLARILWLQGFPDQAMRLVESIVEGAMSSKDMLSLCQVLVQAACPVSLLVGDTDEVARFVGMLLDGASRHGLDFWSSWGRCFNGVLTNRRGDVAGLSLLTAALGELRDIQYGVYYIVFLGEFAVASGRAGQIVEGLGAIEEALARSERNEERWYVAELLRIKGELLLLRPDDDSAAKAEALFMESLDWAQRQQTPSWELRTATSLARLWLGQNQSARARDLLAPIFAHFTEGFNTADLRAARQLLNELDGVEPG
jgi:predicted ATPase